MFLWKNCLRNRAVEGLGMWGLGEHFELGNQAATAVWNRSNDQTNQLSHFVSGCRPKGNGLEMLPFLIYLIDEKQVLHVEFTFKIRDLPGFHLFWFQFSGKGEAGVSDFGVLGQGFSASVSISFTALLQWSRLNGAPVVR